MHIVLDTATFCLDVLNIWMQLRKARKVRVIWLVSSASFKSSHFIRDLNTKKSTRQTEFHLSHQFPKMLQRVRLPVLLWQWLSLQRVLQESCLSLGCTWGEIQPPPPRPNGQNLDSPVNISGAVFEVHLIAVLVKFWHQL